MHRIKEQTDDRSEHQIYMAAIFDSHHSQGPSTSQETDNEGREKNMDIANTVFTPY